MIKLLEFPHSPYVEKVRWALDYKGLPFKRVTLMPGLHILTVRRVAPESTVPVLINGKDVIQDSSKILTYLDKKFPDKNLTPTDAELAKFGLEIEMKSDIQLGANLRRILYFWLLDDTDAMNHFFTHRWGLPKKLLFRGVYPLIRKRISKKYEITKANLDSSITDLDKYLDELSGILGNKKFLLGDELTRTDLAVASILSLLARPKEYPIPYWPNKMPGPAREFMEANSKKDIVLWSRELYAKYR